ncbi:HAMP domain-containing histidine kinase [Waterburya agarophytonicola K14]|uniref:histidine kinase n=1 Tax=Waterburya agarophytonicola KI4 TaxID=2874699 RepID=A0A964FDV0_9CYAN|nr:HAMP domain-containing sensor histidine kinase [Waterburya agarophytonicola]MCC0175496.1 HAMP domain-containing histidine kinase [Waterburya agarophytonicola KI4]
MVLDIVSNKSKNLSSQALRWRLLLSYMGVMMTILGLSALAIYKYTRHNLYEQMDRRLEVLAQAASHNLSTIKANYDRHQEIGLAGNPPPARVRRYLDGDGDLDIPWEHLRQPDQGVEWFDAQKRLVGNAGILLNDLPPQPGWQFGRQKKIRTVTLPAYSGSDSQKQLEGYIRANQVTDEIEVILTRLRWGLGIGGIGVIGLTGLGGIWLTKQSLKPIEQSFEQLKQFTADAAHELRSPLAAIKTSVQVMEYYPERLHPQDLKKIGAIASATDHTIKLVEDLLLLTRIDSGSLQETVSWVELSLTEILEDLLELFQSSAQAKEITLESHLLPNIMVQGDGAELARLFRNIIENALQYTPGGGKVIISMKEERQNILVKIADTGFGIAPEHLSSIFDRFWRADKARTRRAGGMGMGLSIARAIAKRYQGEISVTSQIDIGSCFQVKLPIN